MSASIDGSGAWSVYQLDIFKNIAEGKGHTVAKARAGSGKTTTIMEGLKHVPARLTVLMVAFNKKIEQELSKRAPNGVEVATLHGYGWRQVRGAFQGITLDKYKTQNLVRERLGKPEVVTTKEKGTHETGNYIIDQEDWPTAMAITKVVSLAKSCWVGLVKDMDDDDEVGAATQAIDDIIDTYEVQIGWEPERRHEFVMLVIEILRKSKEMITTADFDDMIWFCLVHNLRVWAFDRVFIDETQDLNPAQIELALRACKRNGRIFAVGDERQAIYGFRGADQNAVENVIERLKAKVMKLTVCYRCAESIVELAAQTVPDFEVAPGAIRGLVETDVSEATLKEKAQVGDFILSRANAPLVSLCWQLIAAGKPAVIQGKDFAGSLLGMIKKARKDTIVVDQKEKPVTTIEDFLDWLDTWQMEEVRRLKKKKKDSASVEDRVACLQALCEGQKSLDQVVAKCETMFGDPKTDEKAGFDEKRYIVLSSTHKAKGLERNRVWVLQDTYRKRPGMEEENLWYVAVTRAKVELYLVVGVGGGSKKKWSVKK